jgi:hypothetical protein
MPWQWAEPKEALAKQFGNCTKKSSDLIGSSEAAVFGVVSFFGSDRDVSRETFLE